MPYPMPAIQAAVNQMWMEEMNGGATGPVLPPLLTAGGLALTDWVVAHDALYATDLATSLVNLVNPGVDDLIAPVAPPTWDAVNGWSFNGSTQFLKSIKLKTNYSMMIQFADWDYDPTSYLFGSYEGSINYAISSDSSFRSCRWGGGAYNNNTPESTGVLIVSNLMTYIDGVEDPNNPIQESVGEDATIEMYLGCVNYPIGGGATLFAPCKIQRFGLVNRALTQGEITALVAALTP